MLEDLVWWSSRHDDQLVAASFFGSSSTPVNIEIPLTRSTVSKDEMDETRGSDDAHSPESRPVIHRSSTKSTEASGTRGQNKK